MDNPHAEPRLETIDLVLAANEERVLSIHGTFYDIQEATGAIQVKIEGQYGARMEKGLGYAAPQGQGYTRLHIQDLSGAPNTVRVAYGEGEFHDRRTTVSGSVSISGAVTLGGTLPAFAAVPTVKASVAANIDDAADVALNNGAETSLGAAPAGTRERIIVANPANTVNIRIGKTGQVGAARGALLQPGQSMTIGGSATVYAYAAAAAQSVSQAFVVD